jgi:hypothetical protein
MRQLWTIAIVICLLFSPVAPYRQVAYAQIPGANEAATLVGLSSLLQNLRSNIDAVINTVDSAAAARLRQAQIIIDKAIQDIGTIIDKGYDAVAKSREEWFKQLFDTLSASNQVIQQNTRLVALEMNKLLITVSTVLDAVPLVNVPSYFVALDPLRIQYDASDRLISFYGYFPTTKQRAARVKVGNQIYPLDRYDHSLGFEIPANLIANEQQYVQMTLQVPKKKLFGWGWEDFAGRLYVEKTEPFTFSVTVRETNPQFTVQRLPAPEFVERADSSHTSNNQTMTSAQVFSRTINDNSKYDMASARFVGLSARVTDGIAPCHCGCDASRASLDYWDANQLQFSLSAPTCGEHWCGVFDHCGGGGTHAEIYLTPTFKVNVRNEPPEIELKPTTHVARRDAVVTIPLNPAWASVYIGGSFKDGDDKNDDTASVSQRVPVATAQLWSARVVNDKLELHTRQGYLFPRQLAPDAAQPSLPKVFEEPRLQTSVLAGRVRGSKASPVSLPFYVYDDQDSKANHFYPSGYVGDPSDLVVNTGYASGANEECNGSGKTCVELRFSGTGNQYAGIYWQDPLKNWGESADGGFDLSGATALRFWARGTKGGEVISEIRVGGIGIGAATYPDSAVVSKKQIKLTADWQMVELPLASADLTHIIGGFYVEFNRSDNPKGATVLVDRIAFVKK